MSVDQPYLDAIAQKIGGHGFAVAAWVDTDGVIRGYKVADGKPRLSVTNYLDDVGIGSVPNHSPRHVFGLNPGVGLTAETISPIQFTKPTSAVPMEIVSTSAQDSSSGTGIRTVEVHGLDADYNEVDQTITLNGLTPVSIPTPLVRIQAVHAKTAGSAGSADGAISIRSIGGGSTYAQIPIGSDASDCCCITVPAGKRAVLKSWGWSSDGAENVRFRLQATMDPYTATLTPGVWQTLDQVLDTSNGERVFRLPYSIPALADVRVIATRLSPGGDSEASAGMELFFEPAA